jgi:hypothetical protein
MGYLMGYLMGYFRRDIYWNMNLVVSMGYLMGFLMRVSWDS